MTGDAKAQGRDLRDRAPRAHRMLAGSLSSARLGTVPIIVRDLSESGLGGRCEAKLTAGEAVIILLPRIDPLPATIAWVKGHRFGAALAARIDPDEVRTQARTDSYEVPSMFRPPIIHRRPGFRKR